MQWLAVVNFVRRMFGWDMVIPHKIVAKSLHLVCMHEAGHVLAARRAGASVHEIEIYDPKTQPYGRTRCNRTLDQATAIAVGGYAVELALQNAKRLVESTGKLLTIDRFAQEVSHNTSVDWQTFFENNAHQWTRDEAFEVFGGAARLVAITIDLPVIERIAQRILTKLKLEKDDIDRLFREIQI